MEFIKAFEEIDKDESGEITRAELEEYMRAKNYKPAFVEKWLRIFDADNSGTITLEEFCTTLGLIPGKKQRERIEKRRNTLKKLELDDKEKEMLAAKAANKEGGGNENNIDEMNNLNGKDMERGLNKRNDPVNQDDKDNNGDNVSMESKIEIHKQRQEAAEPTIDTSGELSKTSICDYMLGKSMEIYNDDVEIIAEDPDISDNLRDFVLKLSLESVKIYEDELEMAKNVKFLLDKNFNKSWNVVAGKESYGCLVTHDEGKFIHVKTRNWGILMWQVLKTNS